MKRIALKAALAIAGISILTACGGGGSSGGGSAAGTALNLQAAFNASVANGSSARGTISGSCTGTTVQTSFPSYAGFTYDSKTATVVDEIQIDTLTGSSASSAFCSNVFDSNSYELRKRFYASVSGSMLPVSSGGTNNGQISSNVYANQTALPTSVTAGSSGTLYTWKEYDNGVAVINGSASYSVAAGDVAGSLLVTLVETGTNIASGRPDFAATSVYRLNSNNTLTPLSAKIETFADNPLGAASALITMDSVAPTLNAATAQAAFLASGNNSVYSLYSSGTQCTGSTATINTQSISGSTTTTSFSTNIVGGISNCSNFNLPTTGTTVYGSANQFISETVVGVDAQNNSYNVTTTASSSPASAGIPNGVTVGSSGTMYKSTRSDSNATATTTYFVGADSATTLMAYEVNTKTYSNGQIGRQIFASRLNANNTLTPAYAFLEDDFTLIKN